MHGFSIAILSLTGFAAGFFYVRSRFWRGVARMYEAQRSEMRAIASAALAGDLDHAYRLLTGSKYMTLTKKPSSRGDA